MNRFGEQGVGENIHTALFTATKLELIFSETLKPTV